MFSKNYTQTHVQTAARECAVLGYDQLSFASPLFHFCDDRGGCFILVRLFEYLFLSDVCFMFVLSGLMFLVFPMMKHIHGFSLFVSQVTLATPNIAFRHLLPNSARFSYAGLALSLPQPVQFLGWKVRSHTRLQTVYFDGPKNSIFNIVNFDSNPLTSAGWKMPLKGLERQFWRTKSFQIASKQHIQVRTNVPKEETVLLTCN